MGPKIKDCIIDDHFGQAREWLLYEMIAYYMQLFQLILFVLSAEFLNKNIYHIEAQRYTEEELNDMITLFKSKDFPNILVFDAHNSAEFDHVESMLNKALL